MLTSAPAWLLQTCHHTCRARKKRLNIAHLKCVVLRLAARTEWIPTVQSIGISRGDFGLRSWRIPHSKAAGIDTFWQIWGNKHAHWSVVTKIWNDLMLKLETVNDSMKQLYHLWEFHDGMGQPMVKQPCLGECYQPWLRGNPQPSHRLTGQKVLSPAMNSKPIY